MAFEFGRTNEFSDPVTIANPIMMVAAKAVELPANTGAFYQSMGAPTVGLTNKKFEIYSRSYTTQDGQITNAWNSTDTSGLSVSPEAARGLTVTHVLKIGGEMVVVKEVNRANNTITVFKRGAAGIAQNHSAGASFTVVGSAGRDIDLKNVEAFSETTSVYTNCVQTVFEAIEWTKHGELVKKGLTPEQAQLVLVREATFRVANRLARMSIHGRKFIPIDYTQTFMSAGLLEQLTDTNCGTRAPLSMDVQGMLTEDKLCDALHVVSRTGRPSEIWCSPTVKRYFNEFLASNPAYLMSGSRTDKTAGHYIDSYDFEGNVLKIRIDNDMSDDQIAIVNGSLCKKGWLTDDLLRMMDEPQLSSREFRKSIQGSVGFCIEGVGYEHILLTGITGGGAGRVLKTMIVNPESAPVPTKEIV